jgi:hypothetical protein
MGAIKKNRYASVEPTRLTAQKTREVFGQLPADTTVVSIENGMGLAYDQKAGKVTYTTAGAGACLVMNEIILPDPNRQQASDFIMINKADAPVYPRLYALHVGDTFITNAVMDDCTKGIVCIAGPQGYWQKGNGTVEVTVIDDKAVLPTGETGVKFVVTKAEA